MKKWSRRLKIRIAVTVLAASLIFGVILFARQKTPESQKLTYSEFVQLVKGGKIKKVEIQYDVIRGNLPDGKLFEVAVNPNYVKPTEELAKYDVSFTFRRYDGGNGAMVAFGCFGAVIIWVWFFFFGISPRGEVSVKFWKSRNERFGSTSKQKVMFADVAGVDEAKAELQEIVEFLKNPKEAERLGANIPKGALLVGPPGNGKTMLAQAVANEAGVPFFKMSGSDFVEMFVGVGASRVRGFSGKGKERGSAVMFIDEIDAIGAQRTNSRSGGDREYQQTLNALLVEMDGFEKYPGVIWMAATNRPEMLDEALTRAGRFDRRVVVSMPDAKGREQILKVHIRRNKVPLGEDVNLADIALGAQGFSGADLANMVNEATLCATRDIPERDKVLHRDFIFAKDKIMLGVESRSRERCKEDMKISAIHEAGHAIVLALVENASRIEKVTTASRGATGGGAYSLAKERDFYTKDQLLVYLAVLMGGRVAEDMFLGTLSSGASGDIQQAANIALKMVGSWGMSELGPIWVDDGTQLDPKHGRVSGSGTPLMSEAKKQRVEAMAEKLVKEAEDSVRRIFSEHAGLHAELANMLLERKTIDGKEVYDLVGDLRGSVKIV